MNQRRPRSKVLISLGVAIVSLVMLIVFSYSFATGELAISQGPNVDLPSVKATVAAAEETRDAEDASTPGPSPFSVPQVPLPTTLTEPVYETPAGAGFIDPNGLEESGSSEVFNWTNSWYEVNGNTITRVYAGGKVRDANSSQLISPVQGFVIFGSTQMISQPEELNITHRFKQVWCVSSEQTAKSCCYCQRRVCLSSLMSPRDRL